MFSKSLLTNFDIFFLNSSTLSLPTTKTTLENFLSFKYSNTLNGVLILVLVFIMLPNTSFRTATFVLYVKGFFLLSSDLEG